MTGPVDAPNPVLARDAEVLAVQRLRHTLGEYD